MTIFYIWIAGVIIHTLYELFMFIREVRPDMPWIFALAISLQGSHMTKIDLVRQIFMTIIYSFIWFIIIPFKLCLWVLGKMVNC